MIWTTGGSMIMSILAVILAAIIAAVDGDAPISVSKSIYRIHGLTAFPAAKYMEWFSQTFDEYLNAEVAPLFTNNGQQIRFVMGSESFETIFTSAELARFDFVFTFPNMVGCLEAEFHAAPIVTLRNFRRQRELNRYGGVIFTRADRNDINTVADLADKVVTGTSILLCQHQWRVFQENGMNMMGDVAQMRFAGDELLMLDDVLSGATDAAFTRTDAIESWQEDASQKQYADKFKILSPRKDVTIDGQPFPFQTTSQLYPESGLLSMPWVDYKVASAVTRALLKLDTTSNATRAGKPGAYAGWQAALSYGEARDLYESLGLMTYNPDVKKFKCIRSTVKDYAPGITCGAGEYKKTVEEIMNSCAMKKIPCPKNYVCICKPCQKGQEIESMIGSKILACNKMEVCRSMAIEQREALQIQFYDNLHRDLKDASIIIRDPEPRRINGTRIGPSLYNITLSSTRTGAHIVQIFMGDYQAPDSPIMIEVTKTVCIDGRIANDFGVCVCPGMSVESNGRCLWLNWLIPTIVLPAIFIICVGAYLYARHKRGKSDSIWKIAFKDLKFKTPPEILGNGTFGVVVRAEYYGTDVAVKRVIPPDSTAMDVISSMTGNNGDSGRVFSSFKSVANRQHRDTEPSIFDNVDTPQPAANIDSKKNDFPDPAYNALGSVHANHARKGFFRKESFVSSFPHLSSSSIRLNNQAGLSSSPSGGTSITPQSTFVRFRLFQTLLGFSDASQQRMQLENDFRHEMKTLSRLRHPNIISVMGAVLEKGKEPMLIMECMENGSLYDLLHNDTILIEADITVAVLRDMLQGILFLHSNRPCFIHGDIKAANILIDLNFRAKVADFGLTQKKKLGVTGTPYWMAPELLVGKSNSIESDIYSVGITLWEMYSRQNPYDNLDLSAIEVLESVVSGMRPKIPEATPAHIIRLMEKCWHGVAVARPDAGTVFAEVKAMEMTTSLVPQQLKTMQASKHHVNDSRDDLLYSIFPRHIADTLKNGGKVDPQQHACASIFFSDIVGFTDMAGTMDPMKVSAMLDRLYSRFDALVREHDVFKVETIGDAYMATTNVVKNQPDHAIRLVRFGLAALAAASETLIDEHDVSKGFITIRIGIHSGPVVSNVVGTANPRYCLFGDAVNIASRMESNSEPKRIHISESAKYQITHQLEASGARKEFDIVSRGLISIKGKGRMLTFWVFPLNALRVDGSRLSLPGVSRPIDETDEELLRTGSFPSLARPPTSESPRNSVSSPGRASVETAGPKAVVTPPSSVGLGAFEPVPLEPTDMPAALPDVQINVKNFRGED